VRLPHSTSHICSLYYTCPPSNFPSRLSCTSGGRTCTLPARATHQSYHATPILAHSSYPTDAPSYHILVPQVIDEFDHAQFFPPPRPNLSSQRSSPIYQPARNLLQHPRCRIASPYAHKNCTRYNWNDTFRAFRSSLNVSIPAIQLIPAHFLGQRQLLPSAPPGSICQRRQPS